MIVVHPPIRETVTWGEGLPVLVGRVAGALEVFDSVDGTLISAFVRARKPGP